ncbi:MAG TPA: TetR/AcrR family transcriptional regulator [Candidatus Goldiibacteriota bacterium]|nr:TetR/AcrR family transcriptional regulator [Candidatus Goldiibacteriota bacterium]
MKQKTYEKKNKILEASKNLFSKYGLKKTTMEEIAANANIAKGTIYNYYHTKEEIFSEVIKLESEILLSEIEKNLKNCKTIREKIRTFVMTKILYYREAVIFYDVSHKVISEMLPEIKQYRNTYLHKEVRILENVLKEGMSCDIIKKGNNAHIIAKSMVIILREFESPWVFDKSKRQLCGMLNNIMDILFHGIAVKERK